jgi:hypothetical protein
VPVKRDNKTGRAIANDKEGTNKKRSATVAPLMKKKLLVGAEANKNKKMQKEKRACFLKFNTAKTNKEL